MAIQDDFTINYSAKTISHTAGTTVYTVNALYSYLMDTFDELDQLDDTVPMSASTPSEYSFINGWTFGSPATDINFLKGGAITDTADDTVWSNIYTIGSDSVISNITLYVVQQGAVLLTAGALGHIDILVKTKAAGTLIDSGLVTIFARDWGYTYDHYQMNLSSGGRQPAPISVQADLANTTASGTVAAYTIGVTFGTYQADVNNDTVNENYEAEIDLNNTHSIAEAYEYLKYITRRGATATVDGVQGQLYTRATATYTELKAAPFGTFAGGKFFGARGVFFKLAERLGADANKYELIDSDNNPGIKEPTSITVAVTNLDGTGPTMDRVLVALNDGSGGVDLDQYTTTASGNTAGSGTVTLTVAPASDTPATGTIRINGTRYVYTGISGAVVTLSGTLSATSNSVPCYIPWIDMEASGTTANVSVSYVADRDVIIRVRQKGIQPFETVGTINSGGLSVATIRTPDNVITI